MNTLIEQLILAAMARALLRMPMPAGIRATNADMSPQSLQLYAFAYLYAWQRRERDWRRYERN